MAIRAARLNVCGAMVCILSALTASSWAAAAPMPSARAQADHSGEHFEFDIPAQPLADALRRFASLTREPTLFRSDLVNGRSSTAVRGLYTSEVALHRLLEGTGLTAEKSDQGGRGGFVLNAIDPSVVAPRVALGNLAGYPGLIQARVWEALCAHARTAPGTYRTLLRFEVDGAGQIQRPRLLTSTGDAHRDAAMLATLLAVRLDGPPPADLPQPVTMLIVPRDAENGDAPSCDDGASGA